MENLPKAPSGYKVLKEGQANILYKEERLQIDDKNMVKTKKGKRQATEVNEVRGAVFYNPVQEFNRDFSILVIREFQKILMEEKAAKKKPFEGINILEALAATGLRSVRYMKEINNIKKLVANDIDPTATELMKKNFDFNLIKKDQYEVYTEDAIDLLNSMRKDKRYFDVIDLDPYGTAVPFLESSLQSMGDGGLLAVTFTDMAVLCSRSPHVCFYKYGAIPLTKKFCHEMALRIVLKMINEIANRQQKYIIPLISLTVDFYIRLFIRVKDGAQPCHESLTKYSHVYSCLECESYFLQPLGCHLQETITINEQGKRKKIKTKIDTTTKQSQQEDEKQEDNLEEEKIDRKKQQTRDKYSIGKVQISNHCQVCDGPLVMGGPIWNQKIHNIDFVKRVFNTVRTNAQKDLPESQREVNLNTSERIIAILTSILDEDIVGHIPLSYDFASMQGSFKVECPKKQKLVAAFKSLGYEVQQTYYDPHLWKTDAPPQVIYDIFKAWKLEFNKGDMSKQFQNISQTSPAYRIMEKKLEIKPNFNEKEVLDKVSRDKQKKKYLPNPQANWGPKARATGGK